MLFVVYFLYLQVFVIGAICVWCTTYGLSLIVRFFVALVVWLRQPSPERASELTTWRPYAILGST